MEEISIKLYPSNGSDVRRFPFLVPKAGVGENTHLYAGIYAALLAKVNSIFPSEWTDRSELAWKDDEGDLIVMRSDMEVMEALRHRKGSIFRMYPRFGDGLERQMSAVTIVDDGSNATSVFIGDDLEKVTNVTPIQTQREEKMETATEPEQQPQQPQQQQQPQADDDANLHRHVICDGCNGDGIRGIRFKCIICPDYDLCQQCCEVKRVHDEHPMIRIQKPDDRSWMAAFWASQTSQSVPGFHFRGGHGKRRGHCPYYAGPHGRHGQRQEPQQGQQQSTQQPPQNQPGFQFLRDVGQAVAAVLNGFGIDVDVDVNHAGQMTKVATPRTDKPEEKTEPQQPQQNDAATNMETTPTVDRVQQTEGVLIDIAPTPTQPVSISPETVDTEVKVPENHPEGWMLVDSPTQQQPAPAVSAPTSIQHASADPRINGAVQHMLNMGFTNEGGWLTQLLEAKNGDIAAVLEILHPGQSNLH